MGAICGWFGKERSHHVELLVERLAHRGACATTWALPPARAVAEHVSFGCVHDDTLAKRAEVPLVFTGTLLNAPELAQRAGLCATEIPADAELLWRLYCREGPDCFAHINGQFALGAYDAQTGALMLVTDRWSVQPLYFAVIEGAWVFASEYRAFLALDAFAPQVDLIALATLQRTKYLPTGRALLANVWPVAPGQFVRLFGTGACEARSYAPLRLDIDERRSESLLAGQLSEALSHAARRLVAGHERIGIALSAGLDSTVTTPLPMARQQARSRCLRPAVGCRRFGC